jgi:hypothetical protein
VRQEGEAEAIFETILETIEASEGEPAFKAILKTIKASFEAILPAWRFRGGATRLRVSTADINPTKTTEP